MLQYAIGDGYIVNIKTVDTMSAGGLPGSFRQCDIVEWCSDAGDGGGGSDGGGTNGKMK